MAWFALGRVMFVVVVAYAAALLQPLSVGIFANVGFGLALAALVVLFESRLRETAVTECSGRSSAARWGSDRTPYYIQSVLGGQRRSAGRVSP